MSCDSIVFLIENLPFSRDPESDQLRIENHVQDCQSCAKTYSDMQNIETALRHLDLPTPPETLAPVVIARLNQKETVNDSVKPIKTPLLSRYTWMPLFGAFLFSLLHQAMFLSKDSALGLQSIANQLQNNLQALTQGSLSSLLLAMAMLLAVLPFIATTHEKSQT